MTTEFSEQRAEAPEEKAASKDPIGTLFAPPPLIDGETVEAYEAFKAQVRAAIGPVDAIDEILIRQFVDAEWDVQRLRRLKGKYLQVSKIDGLREALRPLVHKPDLEAFVEAWARRDPQAIEEVSSILGEAEVDLEHVTALALVQKLKDFEAIDRLIAVAESRRNQALRELERHHEALARRVQSAAKQIEDGEFRVVEPELEVATCD